MSEQWRGLHNDPRRHRPRGEMDAWCDWCGDCAEDQPCRCCLAVEMTVLKANLLERQAREHRVRELCDLTPTVLQEDNGEIIPLVPIADILHILDGGDA